MTSEKIKLTNEQVEQLYIFVERKFVRYYDIQVELVDHLASQIEEMMYSEPNISFDVALAKVYVGFGIFGFHNLVKSKTKSSYRQVGKLWWAEFKQLFSWPEIIKVGLIAGLTYLLQHWLGWLFTGVACAIMFVLTAGTVLSMGHRKTKPIIGLSVSYGIFSIQMSSVLQIALHWYLHFGKLNANPLLTYAAFVTVITSFYALVIVHLKMIKAYQIQYPQAFG